LIGLKNVFSAIGIRMWINAFANGDEALDTLLIAGGERASE
jgi:hypothetical protein